MKFKRPLLAVAALLAAYLAIYLVHSRVFAETRPAQDVSEFCFSEDPDWAHGCFIAYYPLIRLDEALFPRRHVFFVDYL